MHRDDGLRRAITEAVFDRTKGPAVFVFLHPPAQRLGQEQALIAAAVRDGRSDAPQHSVDGRRVYIGYFDTAVEAAVAYARAVGEYQPPAPPTVAAEAEGLRLHLSSSSSTGYKGVYEHASGRFKAQHRAGERMVYLGSFATAVEAAVAYARAAGEYQPPAVVTEAEGQRQRLSSSNATGYMGVYTATAWGGRFQASRCYNGGRQVIGNFGTAVEAAVAYARAVGEYQPPAPPPIVAAEAEVVAEAEGLRLNLSSNSATGYKGVRKSSPGRFEVSSLELRSAHAQIGSRSDQLELS